MLFRSGRAESFKTTDEPRLIPTNLDPVAVLLDSWRCGRVSNTSPTHDSRALSRQHGNGGDDAAAARCASLLTIAAVMSLSGLCRELKVQVK